MRIAAAAYPIDWFDSWTDYVAKLTRWVTDAVGQDADLLVFPEYGAMELAALGRPDPEDVEGALRAAAEYLPAADALHSELAQAFGVTILSASGPVYDGERPTNRARLFGP